MRESLDIYDVKPEEMTNYLRYYGRHFNRKLCDFAVSLIADQMDKPISKNQLDEILAKHKIQLKNNTLYDYVYVANMCKADFLGSSIKDEEHMALYIKDVIDDKDGYDGIVFNRWYADVTRKGIPVDWESVL